MREMFQDTERPWDSSKLVAASELQIGQEEEGAVFHDFCTKYLNYTGCAHVIIRMASEQATYNRRQLAKASIRCGSLNLKFIVETVFLGEPLSDECLNEGHGKAVSRFNRAISNEEGVVRESIAAQYFGFTSNLVIEMAQPEERDEEGDDSGSDTSHQSIHLRNINNEAPSTRPSSNQEFNENEETAPDDHKYPGMLNLLTTAYQYMGNFSFYLTKRTRERSPLPEAVYHVYLPGPARKRFIHDGSREDITGQLYEDMTDLDCMPGYNAIDDQYNNVSRATCLLTKIQYYQSTSMWVRQLAASMNGADSQPYSSKVFAQRSSDFQQMEAARALMHLNSPHGIDALTRVLKDDDRSIGPRLMAYEALAVWSPKSLAAYAKQFGHVSNHKQAMDRTLKRIHDTQTPSRIYKDNF